MRLASAPSGFVALLEPLPAGVTIGDRLRSRIDVCIFFPASRADLTRRIRPLADSLLPNGGLWVAWPKKAAVKRALKVPTDLDFGRVQQAGLAAGLVDNKVCAVSDVYSGLRFVFRLRDRT